MKKRFHFALKQKFIEDHLKENICVDILNAPFVDAYIEKFNCSYKPKMWGAHYCADLSKSLKRLYDCNILDRCKVALGEGPHSGFPSWVYSYSLKQW